MSLLTMLEATCTIMRATTGQDANMGTTLTYDQTVISNYPCSQQEASAHIRALYKQIDAEVPATLYFMDNPNTQAGDLAIVTASDAVGGGITYYNVQGKAKNVGRGLCPWTVEVVYVEQPT